MLKTLRAGPSMTKHCRKPSHSRPKRKSLKIIQIQGQSLEKLNNSNPLISRIEELYCSKKVTSVKTSQYEISSKNHICSVKTFSTEHNLPIREKQIHWNKQHCGMSKSGVLPTLSSSSRETAVMKISIRDFFCLQ